MKLTVKTLKGTHFEIRALPNDTIMAVKKNIEEIQGKDSYPWGQQLLIHNGKVLKDESTLDENKVTEDGFLVVMLSKSKTPASGSSSAQPAVPAPTPAPAPVEAPPQTTASLNPATQQERSTSQAPSDVYGQAASNIVAGSNLDPVVNQLMDMGGGSWDKETVIRALRAAYNNPERAVEYLYSGIPETVEVAVPAPNNPNEAAMVGSSPLSGLPNASPLNMFPQGTPSLGAGAGGGSLDFLRSNPQFQALRAMVQANPQILQPMLQELSKQNPQLLRLIQDHHAEFLQLINEPVEGIEGIEGVEGVEGVEGDMFDQADQEMPHAISVTPAEQESIGRLEAMGFDRARVIEAFLACDRNEELAANYLLEHLGDED